MRQGVTNLEIAARALSRWRAVRRPAEAVAAVRAYVCLLAALCVILLGGAITAAAQNEAAAAPNQDTVTWTPYMGTPNGVAAFQAYPGGQSTDNTIVLTISGEDTVEGPYAGSIFSITGPNAAQFQEDTSILPNCGTRPGNGAAYSPPIICAFPIYFVAPSTPGTYTATLTYSFEEGLNGPPFAASQSITLTGTVLPVPTPTSSVKLAFVSALSTFAGTGMAGYSGNNGPAIDAELNNPSGVAIDGQGNVYIADAANYVVRKVDTNGKISVYAGTPQEGGIDYGYSGEGGPATSATLNAPMALALDASGNLYFADGTNAVRVVNAATGKITTYAGSPGFAYGYAGDGGPATSALLFQPVSLAFDSKGNLYIAEEGSNDVRMVSTSGIITTYAGQNTYNNEAYGAVPIYPGYSGDGGPASAATLFHPSSLTVDANNNLYIADAGNSRVRVVNPTTGIISTVAGFGAFGAGSLASIAAEDLPADTAELAPFVVTLDEWGNYYIVTFYGQIFMVDSSGNITQFPSANYSNSFLEGSAGVIEGYVAGEGTPAPGMDFSSSGAMYIAAPNANAVYAITAPDALTFGSVNVGSASLDQYLTLQNTGSGPLSFAGTPYTVTGNFAVDNAGSCSFNSTLPAGETCTVGVIFSPQSDGPLMGTVSFATTASGAPLVAQLSGTGAGSFPPSASLDKSLIEFPPTAVGAQSTGQTTLTNNSSSALTNIDIAIQGASPADFSIDPATTCGPMLAGGDSCMIVVDFDPQALLSYAAILNVADNASNSPQIATLNGTGLSSATLTVSEAIHFSDASPDLNPAIPLSVVETVNFGDAPALSPSLALNVTEAVHFSDVNPRLILPTPLSVVETVNFGDAPALSPSIALNVTETVHLSDANPHLILPTPLSVIETVNFGDAPALSPSIALNVAEAVHFSDANPHLKLSTSLNVIETIQFADADTLVAHSKTPVVHWPDPAPIVYGTPLSGTQLDATSSVTGTFIYTPPAGTVLAVGSQTLQANFTPSNLSAYTKATVSTTLRVNPASLTITANKATREYGIANPAFTGTIFGAVNHDVLTESFSTSATQLSSPGTYTIVPSVAGTHLSSYNVTAIPGVLTINKAATSIEMSAVATSVSGGTPVTFHATVGSTSKEIPIGTVTLYSNASVVATARLQNGSANFTSQLSTGTDSVTAVYSGDPNFDGSTSSAVTISVSDFEFTPSSGSRTVVPGGTALYTFAVFGSGGAFINAIKFSASGLPAGATATFDPPTVTPNRGSPSTTLAIQVPPAGTTARTTWVPGAGRILSLAVLLPLFGLWHARRRLHRSLPAWTLSLFLGLALTISGCGSSGFFDQPPQTYSITITGTSGDISHSQIVTLTVE